MTTNAPPRPLWLTVITVIQLFFAVVTLGLSAYSLSYFGAYSGYGLNIFTSIVTFLYFAYIIVATMFVQTLYNIWISIGLQAFLAIFWLSTFGTLAALSVAFATVESYSYHSNGYRYTYGGYNYDGVPAVATTKAATALSAFLWVSFVATLIYSVLSAVRHGRNNSVTATSTTGAQEHKLEPVAGGPPTAYQPVQQFPTQPYAAPGQEYQQQQQQPYGAQPVAYQQQPAAYPVQSTTPSPYQESVYPQQTGSPAPYQTPVQYPQQTGSPAPYPQQTGSPAPYPPQQQQQQQVHEMHQ